MLPTPVLASNGQEDYETGGQKWTRYRLTVSNRSDFSSDLFARSPDLPPCGANASAARSWVDIHDASTGAHIYSFCALASSADLGDIWFAVPQCQIPPQAVYITIHDRRDNVYVASNVVSTVVPKPHLVLKGQIERTSGDKTVVEYQLSITNRAAFPDSFFAPSPDLPPSGLNTSAARTWVEIYNATTNAMIYGFTALGHASELDNIWFAVARGTAAPSGVYVVLHDRRCNIKYRSNTISTAIPAPQIAAGGTQQYSVSGKYYTRYRLVVLNRAEIPDYLFAPSSDLPPCGLNNNSSRTWVDLYDADTKARLNGFCAFNDSENLAQLWFAIKDGNPAPKRVYVVLRDRRAGVDYTSSTLTL